MKRILLAVIVLLLPIVARADLHPSTGVRLGATLQSGATFYVSSGTANNFYASTITVNGTQPFLVVSFSSFTIAASSASVANAFVPTGLKRTITPLSSNSRFEISVVGQVGGSNVTLGTPFATLNRGATNLGDASNGFCEVDETGTLTQARAPCSFVVVDSPATASAVTYEVYIKSDGTRTTTWGLNTTFMFIKEYDH